MLKTTEIWPVPATISFVLSDSHSAPAQSSIFSVSTSDLIGKRQIYRDPISTYISEAVAMPFGKTMAFLAFAGFRL
jgi:hypothetical protein